jgi:hypothetical protein
MKQIWDWIRNNPNRAMFLVPIFLVAGISISHVVSWYSMANPISWAIYLSIAIEVGAMTALIAATNKIKGGVWFMFGLVTFIQMIGNIFYSYVHIDESGELFLNWVELTGPVWEIMGTELTDIIGLKRYLAFLEGGLLPLISLTSLHFFVKYEKEKEVIVSIPEGKEFNTPYPVTKDNVSNTPIQDYYNTTTEPITDPPLEVEEFDEDHSLDMVMNNMVEDLMEEEGHETVGDLIESLNEDKEVDLTQFVSPEVATKEIDSKEESITEEVINVITENPVEEQSEIDIPNESQVEVIETSVVKQETPQRVDNKPPKKRMGIDRIR